MREPPLPPGIPTPALDWDGLQRTWQSLAARFAKDDPGRSIALVPLHDTAALIGIGPDIPRPGGSVLKLPLVATVFDEAAEGMLDLAERVSVTRLSSSKWPSLADALHETVELSLFEICAFTIVTSDNPCADFLVRLVGFDRVNRWMTTAGLSDGSRLGSSYADMEIEKTGRDNRITARDCVLLFSKIFAEPRFAPLCRLLYNNVRNQRIPRLLDDDVCVAHKTGSLNGVVNDAGVIARGGRMFVAVFLCEDQKDPFQTEIDISHTARDCLDAFITATGV